MFLKMFPIISFSIQSVQPPPPLPVELWFRVPSHRNRSRLPNKDNKVQAKNNLYQARVSLFHMQKPPIIYIVKLKPILIFRCTERAGYAEVPGNRQLQDFDLFI